MWVKLYQYFLKLVFIKYLSKADNQISFLRIIKVVYISFWATVVLTIYQFYHFYWPWSYFKVTAS